MSDNFKEAFEKTRIAGIIAAGALDEVAKIAKPGTRTDEIDKLCYDYLNDNDWVIQTFGKDAGPSKNYINPKYKGKFGVIAPYSKDFCKSCNRLRITAKGDLRLCLFGNTGINIRHLMQRDNQTEELKDLILKQLNYKKESHYLEIGETGLTKNLSTTGG